MDLRTLRVWRSPEARVVFGLPADRGAGEEGELLDPAHPADRALLEQRTRAEGEGQAEVEAVVALEVPGGGTRQVLLRSRLERDAASVPLILRGIALDVTGTRKLGVAAERGAPAGSALEGLPVALAVFDSDLRLLRANARGRAALGLPTDAQIAGAGRQARPELPRALAAALQECVAAGKGSFCEVRQPEWAGGRIVSCELAPLEDDAGKVVQVICAAHDVTAQREAEAAAFDAETRLRALAIRAEAAREEEQARVARDLHDDLGQLVTALHLELAQLERRLESADAPPSTGELTDRAVAARELAGRMLEAVRRIARDVRPQSLEAGLLSALQADLDKLRERTAVECVLSAGPIPPLPPPVAAGLYRIAQEALTNVARHARARRVEVALEVSAAEARLSVSDDGEGIDPALASRSLGMLGMRERARALGGVLQVVPRAGAGTTVQAVVPLRGRWTGP